MSITLTEQSSRISMPKDEVNVILDRCVGCQECIIRCPTRALSIDVSIWKAKADNELCVGCRQCERCCPFSAITVAGPVKVEPRVGPPPNRLPTEHGSVVEVRPGFARIEDAIKEAKRCLNCPDPTCVLGCPAHNDIPAFIEAITKNDLPRAQQILAETTCLPDICSRICDWANQCEGACNWALAGKEPVAIGTLERFVTDNSEVPPITRVSDRGNKLSVGVLGCGPAGIAAACELAKNGVAVTIYEKNENPGGILHWGIPSYVLPDAVSRRPIKALIDAGIKIKTGINITPQVLEQLLGNYDAVIVAFGAPVPVKPDLPGVNLSGVINATDFLTRAKAALSSGKSLPEFQGVTVPVLVLGGSDTAIDVARSIIRLGGKPIIIHRRDEHFSRARADEIAEAKKERVEFRFTTNLISAEGKNGVLKKVVLVKTRQKNIKKQPLTIKGSEHTVDTKTLVLATGYKLEKSFYDVLALPSQQPVLDRLLPDRRWLGSGIFNADSDIGSQAWEREYPLRVSIYPRREKLWVVGDALLGPGTVVGAMGQGRLAAKGILE
jgi:glutamate synthase (NADPH/NADH) small chain